MTIETAVPSSAETLAALFDNLVEAVAQRVTSKIAASVVRAEIEAWADDHLNDRLDNWATYRLDLSHEISEALDNIDLSDKVREEIQNLTFNVSVE